MNQLLVLAILPLVGILAGRFIVWLIKRYASDPADPAVEFYSQLDAYRNAPEERKLRILGEVKRRLML
ncbi:hypothetical protein ACEN9F_10575 [Duganella sp. CT11-25]|jgi:hypothetical protein|uniref:hypothetical protein n=1 Tax=unclassified Duganella TaxID=2636909 RepID=UPI0039AF32BC